VKLLADVVRQAPEAEEVAPKPVTKARAKDKA